MQTDSAQSSEAQDSEQTSSQQSSSAPSGGGGDAPARKKLRLSYEQYKQLANMLVLHMRKEEEMLPGLFIPLQNFERRPSRDAFAYSLYLQWAPFSSSTERVIIHKYV